MRYTVLVDGRPLFEDGRPVLAFLPDLPTAKEQGEKLAANKPDIEVCIEGYPEKAGLMPVPMPTWRFDREVNAWIETTAP